MKSYNNLLFLCPLMMTSSDLARLNKFAGSTKNSRLLTRISVND